MDDCIRFWPARLVGGCSGEGNVTSLFCLYMEHVPFLMIRGMILNIFSEYSELVNLGDVNSILLFS